jgi:signal transduction histidine kinase
MSKTQSTASSDPNLCQDFVNIAVHELKTPVSVMKAYLQLIMKQLHSENLTGYIATVEKMDLQLDKLLHLIADLQDGMHGDSNEIHCLMNDFSINDAIKGCYDNLKARYPQLTAVCNLAPDDPVVTGDRDRIEQVLNNLINNAVKYAGKENYLEMSAVVAGNHIVVSVVDKGPGIPEEKQEKIFQRFYRVKSPLTQQQSGLGLGLFICTQIIRKHHGQIGVNSEEGVGSEFWFSIPIRIKTSV